MFEDVGDDTGEDALAAPSTWKTWAAFCRTREKNLQQDWRSCPTSRLNSSNWLKLWLSLQTKDKILQNFLRERGKGREREM